jgi:hypothetical protein
MTWTNWNAIATATAEYARANLSHLQRGTIKIKLRANGSIALAYFGNDINEDGFQRDILQSGAEELAFACSENGQTWCMLVAPSKDGMPVVDEERSECTISI